MLRGRVGCLRQRLRNTGVEERVKKWPDSLNGNWWRRRWPITWTEESNNRYSIDFLVPWCTVGHGFLIIDASRLHSDTSYSVGLLWTSDRPRDLYLTESKKHNTCARRDSIPKSQQVRGCRPKPSTVLVLGSDLERPVLLTMLWTKEKESTTLMCEYVGLEWTEKLSF